MDPDNTTAVDFCQQMQLLDPLHRLLYRTRMKKARKSVELAKELTPYNQRANKAFEHGKEHKAFRTQEIGRAHV